MTEPVEMPCPGIDHDYLLGWSAFYTSCAAAVTALAGWAARAGLPDQGALWIAESLAVTLLLVNGPVLLRAAGASSASFFRKNMGVLILVVLLFVLSAGWLLGRLAALPLSMAGILAFMHQTARLVRSGHRRLAALAIPAAGFTGLTIIGVAWGYGYLSPTFAEALAYERGTVDPIFHIAICNMVNTYGVPSTGLDGVPYLPYHTGSHCALAALARLFDISGIEVYNLTFPIIFYPLFLFSLQAAGIALLRQGAVIRPLGSLCILWYAPMSILGGILPDAAAGDARLAKDSFISESMCFALVLFFCAIAAGLSAFKARPVQLNWGDRLLAALGVPLLVAVTTVAKVSVGFVLVVATAYLFLRWARLRSNPLAGLTVVGAIAAFLLVLRYTYYPLPDERFLAPFDFLFRKVQVGYWAYYFPLSLAWLTLVIYFGLWTRAGEPKAGLRSSPSAYSIAIEFAVVVAAAGFGPGLLLWIPGGSAFYFLDIQRWVSVLLLIPLGVEFLQVRHLQAADSSGSPGSTRLLVRVVFGVLMVASVGTMAANTLDEFHALFREMLDACGAKATRITAALSQLVHEGSVAVQPPDPLKMQLIESLQRIGRLPHHEKQRTVLYIPQSNRTYWAFFTELSRQKMIPRKASPLLAPAVAGVALIDGLPDPDPVVTWKYLGYDIYPIPSQPQVRPPLQRYRAELLAKAERAGFLRVIVLDDAGQRIQLQEWCSAGIGPLLDSAGNPLGP